MATLSRYQLPNGRIFNLDAADAEGFLAANPNAANLGPRPVINEDEIKGRMAEAAAAATAKAADDDAKRLQEENAELKERIEAIEQSSAGEIKKLTDANAALLKRVEAIENAAKSKQESPKS